MRPRVYIRHIMCSTMYLLVGTGVRKIISVACGFSTCPIKINFSDFLEKLISRIDEVYVYFNKIWL